MSDNEELSGQKASLRVDIPDSLLRPELSGFGDHIGDEHFVQFYESEEFLIESVAKFVSSGFDGGETVLVVATKQHLNALRAILRKQNFHLEQLENAGIFVVLDTEKVLSDIIVDGSLSRERFDQAISGLLGKITSSGRPLRVFGELVAVLWAQGKYATALEIEELWDDLKKKLSFSLYCAYPMHAFTGKDMAEPLRKVCLAHSRIVPAESYTALSNLDEKLRAIADLQQQSVSLEHEILEHGETQDRLRATRNDLEVQLVKLEEALQREQLARREAEAANRLKDEFLATISHELRTPLNAIVGWSHLLSQGRLDGLTSTRAMESIERNAKAQAQMIEDLIDVSRMAAGSLILKSAKVDLAVVIHAAFSSLQRAAEAKDIEVIIDLEPGAYEILGDPRRIQQIFWHLFDNAIKFTPLHGQVRVSLKQHQSNVEISVEDSGQGIEADFLKSVFERFRQADSSTTRRHGGLGVGLSIVRNLVELHGGSISVESEGLARGAKFVVSLPRETPTKLN